MSRTRTLTLIALLAAPAADAGAFQAYRGGAGGKGLKLGNNVEEAVNEAKKTQRPLLFYIEGDLEERDERDDDNRRKALLDANVAYAARNFIGVRVIRSHSGYQWLFEKLNVPRKLVYLVVFATPNGEKFDEFRDVHLAENFADYCAGAFKKYRKRLYDEQLKPLLEDDASPVAEVDRALKLVEKFVIVEADKSVLKTLDRRGISDALTKQCHQTLAELSTKDAVEFLLTQAVEGAPRPQASARDALAKCTPAAAELMAAAFDEDNPRKALEAYKAVVKVCGVKSPKQDSFFEKADESRVREEFTRVKRDVEKAAKRWSDKYADYR